MALTGKLGQIKYYLCDKLLKGIVKKRLKLQVLLGPLIDKEQRDYMDCIIQEKLLVKILKDCFNLDVDTALIAMSIQREFLLQEAGIKNKKEVN